MDIAVEPPRPGIEQMVGVRGGGHSRARLAELLPDDLAQGAALYLLLDDFAGISLVAPWAWSLWTEDWQAFVQQGGVGDNVGKSGVAVGICTGFQPGSSGLTEDGRPGGNIQHGCLVADLAEGSDPLAWHVLPAQSGVAMRRARRIDVWREGDTLFIDAGFQDSAPAPGGTRAAIHEYGLRASADAMTQALLSLEPRPHILPLPECPGAVAHSRRLLGQRLDALRSAVPNALSGVLGCTHLNDVLRSLADVPRLADQLDREPV